MKAPALATFAAALAGGALGTLATLTLSRSEAAETLKNYIDEPDVRAVLLYASENDSSQSVRKDARGSLN